MAMDPKLAKKLAQAQKNWAKAKPQAAAAGGGFDEIDDGRYLARLTGAQVVEAKSSGRLQIQWIWTIADGDYKGHKKYDYEGLETETNLIYIGRKIARFGYELPDDIVNLQAILDSIVAEKPLAKIKIKSKGDFQNVYVDSVIESADEQEALEEAAGEESDEGDVEGEDSAEAEVVEEEAEAEPEAEEEADSVELSLGMRVQATTPKGKSLEGMVIELLEKTNEVRIKTDDQKIYKISQDSLTGVVATEDAAADAEEEDEAEEVPEEPVKPAKATKAAPAAAAPVKKGKK